MALRKTRAQDMDVNALLDAIDVGVVALPNFQRDFDWTDEDVRSLLGTILSGWPIGSLLLIEGANAYYSPRSIEAGPPISSPIEYVILDGQQRLTALYQALYGKGPLRYSLLLGNMQGYEDIDRLDESLVSHKTEVWERLYPNPVEQWRNGLLPMAALRDATEFFQWRDEAIPADEPENRAKLTALYRRDLSGIHAYQVPSVIIPRDIDPAAVARIFERVNRAGMRLGTFDLMVARSFSAGFNLRAVWEAAREANPLVRRFLAEDGLPILSVIALRQKESLRQSAVLELPGSAIRDGWDAALIHFNNAIRYGVERLGLLRPDWIPYRPILTVLAALDYDTPLAQQHAAIGRWYWATALGRRYDVASNTRAVSDYLALVQGNDPVPRPPVMIEEVFLESTLRQQGALHRAFLTAIASGLDVSGGSSDPSGADEARFRISARSLYDRTSDGVLDPPADRRTLTFALFDEVTGKLVNPRSQLLRGPAVPEDPSELLNERLRQLHTFASEKMGASVRLIPEAEWEREQDA